MAVGVWNSLRQHLREWLHSGPDKARCYNTRVEVALFLAPLLGWLLSWLQGHQLDLAIDATLHRDLVSAPSERALPGQRYPRRLADSAG